MEVVSLNKGEKVDLTKGNPGLSAVVIGLGWDINTSKSGGDAFDLDAFALALNEQEKTAADRILFFGSPKTGNPANPKETAILDKSLIHTGDNLTGEGDGDDEQIIIDLSKVPADVNSVLVGVSIYQAAQRKQNFGMVKNAFIRAVDKASNSEMLKFDLSEDSSKYNTMVLGKVYRHNGEWKFQAVGEGFDGDINTVASKYL
jgi:tellurium resistance protein TerD